MKKVTIDISKLDNKAKAYVQESVNRILAESIIGIISGQLSEQQTFTIMDTEFIIIDGVPGENGEIVSKIPVGAYSFTIEEEIA